MIVGDKFPRCLFHTVTTLGQQSHIALEVHHHEPNETTGLFTQGSNVDSQEKDRRGRESKIEQNPMKG